MKRWRVLCLTLVAGVVGDHEDEAVARLDDLAELLDRQQTAVVGERVDEDGRVLARLDDLVEITDRADLRRARQRAVHPARRVALQQVAADEVGCGEVFVAGDGHERHAGFFAVLRAVGGTTHHRHRAAELVGHVLDEAGLAAAGRALEEHRYLLRVGGLEERYFVVQRLVVRLLRDEVLFHGVLAVS